MTVTESKCDLTGFDEIGYVVESGCIFFFLEGVAHDEEVYVDLKSSSPGRKSFEYRFD